MRIQPIVAVLLVLSAAHCGFPLFDENGSVLLENGIACAEDANCDDGNPCTMDTCPAATLVCEYAKMDGYGPVSAQTSGDCSLIVCSAGQPSTNVDTQDIFDDGESCTLDTCVNQVPTNTPVVDGTVCTVSNMSGTCVKGVCTP